MFHSLLRGKRCHQRNDGRISVKDKDERTGCPAGRSRPNSGILGFARLAIMGLTPDGMQPFQRDGSWVICNGEIYGFRKIKKELEERGYQFQSGSDCEVLLPLY